MGVSVDSGSGGGKRQLNAELNLVPFIDLLVCCICFLLITSVWSQMARIEVNQQGPGRAAKKEEEDPLREMQVKITVLVADDEYVVSAGSARVALPKQGSLYDIAGLAEELRELKSQFQDKDDITVAVEDGVRYEDVVQAMDVALKQSFTNIRLADSGAAAM